MTAFLFSSFRLREVDVHTRIGGFVAGALLVLRGAGLRERASVVSPSSARPPWTPISRRP